MCHHTKTHKEEKPWQGTDHLGAFEVRDAERDLGDGVAAHQLHNLRCGCELGIHLHRRQLQVLSDTATNPPINGQTMING